MKYIIAIDSDGTLRKSDGTISEFTKMVIKKQTEKGNIIVICTARPRYHTLKVCEEVSASKYLISSNGSEIYDVSNNEVIYGTFLTKKDCEKIYKYAKDNDLRIVFTIENTEYSTKFIRNENQILLDDNNFDCALNSKIKQCMVIGKEKEKIIKFKNIVLNEYKMNVFNSSNLSKEEIWFSVASKKASKGNALLKLSNYLGIPIKNTIAIGNDNNDISMIKQAGLGVAVANATEDLLKQADIIIDSNDNNGVAKFLESIL